MSALTTQAAPINFAQTQNDIDLRATQAKLEAQRNDTFANLEKLHKQFSNPQIDNSYQSMEGSNSENKNVQALKWIRDYIPAAGLAVASAMHIIAGLDKLKNVLPESLSSIFDKYALGVSKASNLLNYLAKGASALIHGRSWDAIGRLAFLVPSFASQENFFLFSGVSSGITMMEQGHIDYVKKSSNLAEDFVNNCKAFKNKIVQVFSKGFFNKDRLVFRGREIEEKHKGTMFISSFGNFFGAILGMISPNKDSSLRKVAAIVRNIGSAGCDWGKFFHKDINNKLSAVAYAGVSVLDILQTFYDGSTSRILSHFSLAINNLANFFYVNTSKARDENTYEAPSKSVAPNIQLAF